MKSSDIFDKLGYFEDDTTFKNLILFSCLSCCNDLCDTDEKKIKCNMKFFYTFDDDDRKTFNTVLWEFLLSSSNSIISSVNSFIADKLKLKDSIFNSIMNDIATEFIKCYKIVED